MRADRRRDPLSLIQAIVFGATKYMRHYVGEVRRNDDPLRRGRILAQVPELGWSSDATAAWCWPRDRHSMDVPRVGERVEVYFVAGDPNRPAYLGRAAEINGEGPPGAYSGPEVAVLHEDPVSGDALRYEGGAFHVAGDKALVTWSELNSALQGLVAAINTALGTKLDGGGTTGALSLDLSAAEAKKAKAS